MGKAVIVLGDARSGTSITSGILQAIGVDMNGNSGRKCNGNPNGAFEDRTVLHKTVAWKQELDKGATIEQLRAKYGDWVKKWVQARKNSLWGWKSAQTHYSIDLVMPYLEQPHFVLVYRNPFHQAISLQVGNDREISHSTDASLLSRERRVSAANTLHYMKVISTGHKILESILERYPQVPFMIVAKEDIADDPCTIAESLCAFLQVPCTDITKKRVNEVVIKKYSSWKKGGVKVDWGKR